MVSDIDANLQIRPATNADTTEVKAVIFGVLREFGFVPDPQDTDKDLDNIEGNYHADGGYFGVVEEQGKIIATVALSRIDDKTCELRKMYLLPGFRGRGLGKKLLDFSLQKAQAMGFRRMVLETASNLTDAIRLYQRYGFKQCHPQEMASRCDLAFERDL